MNKKNIVEVVIGGEVYKLISEESEEHIQKVANYINKKINELEKKNPVPTINNQIKSLHVTINIADDFIKQQNKYEEVISEFETGNSKLTALESENHILKQKVKFLQSELDKAKLELYEYIETFDEKNNK